MIQAAHFEQEPGPDDQQAQHRDWSFPVSLSYSAIPLMNEDTWVPVWGIPT